MTHHARGSRTGRVIDVLHRAGIEGLMLHDISVQADVKPYDVKEILTTLRTKKHPPRVVILAMRRNTSTNKPEEVYACACPIDHHPRTVEVDDGPPPDWRIADETRQLGMEGLAAARARLAEANQRKAVS